MIKGVVSHPMGNRNVREVLKALQSVGCLDRFITSVDMRKWEHFLPLLHKGMRAEFEKRRFQELSRSQVSSYEFNEVIRQLLNKLGVSGLSVENPFSVDGVYRAIDHHTAKYLSKNRDCGFVYAYEDGALESFRVMKSNGGHCFYDLPIAYFETSFRLLKEEAERYPKWAGTLGIDNIPQSKIDRKEEEIHLADSVICASNFVLNSLPPSIRENKRCYITHFGCDLKEGGEFRIDESLSSATKLKVLFVGRISQRKGLADLVEAVRRLKSEQIELHLLGPMDVGVDLDELLGIPYAYHGTKDRAGVLRMMRTSHVLVLPSLVEGRALVQLEALAQGLPLIISTNTGGEDLIEEGKTGYMVPIRNPEAIAERLDFLRSDLSHTLEMRTACRKKASLVTWGRYQQKVSEIITSI